MKKALITLAFLLSFFASRSYAQSSLSMNDSTVFLSSNDTLSGGTNLIYTGTIFNESAQTFNDYIWAASAVDTMGTQGIDTANFIYLSTHVLGSGLMITLSPNDSIGFTDTIVVGSEFKSGINTVVIWPITNMPGYGPAKDTAHFNVFVLDPLVVKNETIINELVLYPNPFSDKVWFLSRGTLILEEVRIVDALGRVVFIDKTQNKPFIETAELSQGVYFIELSYNNGLKKRIKVMKQ